MTTGLRRASAADMSAVVALQRVVYAANRVILGVAPLPPTAVDPDGGLYTSRSF